MMGNFKPLRVNVFPTGSLNLDIALDVGGLPRGRIAEIYGPPASGKTTLVQHIVAEAQKRGNNVIFIDMEHCLDPRYAERCGIRLKDVLLAQPKTGEEALQIAKRSLNSGDIDLVILDSIAALVTRAEIKAPSLRPAAGEINRLLPLAFREISLACIRNNASLICTNQLRTRLKTGYGPSETTPGGLSIKFHASVRISLEVRENLHKHGEIIGSKIAAKITKNTFGLPFRCTIFNIVYNIGIPKSHDLLVLGKQENLIIQDNAQLKFGKYNLGENRHQAQRFLSNHPDIAEKLEQALRNKLFPKPPIPMTKL